MAIAHDAQTRFPTADGPAGTDSSDTTTGDRSFTHNPVGVPKGIVVVVISTATAQPCTGVTYGGVSMSLEQSATDTTETGSVWVWVLAGVAIPTDDPATVVLQGCTADAKWATCSSVTAATTGTALVGENAKNTTTAANPTLSVVTSATSLLYGGLHGGAASPATYVVTADYTSQFNNDWGPKSSRSSRRTSPVASGTIVYDFTAGSDDYCIAAVALGEFTLPIILTADGGAFAETGTAATLKVGHVLVATTGSFSETGTSATFVFGRSVIASAGSFVETGSPASLIAARRLSAGSGSFAQTGSSASLLRSSRLIVDAGAFAETGSVANLTVTRSLAAASGSFAQTGSSAALLRSSRLVADAGAFASSGQSASLLFGRALAAAPGSFAETGSDGNLLAGHALAAESGSFAESGASAALLFGRVLSAGSGSFVETGSDADLVFSGGGIVLSAAPGSFAFGGTDAALLAARRLSAETGDFVGSGTTASLLFSRIVSAVPGAFVETGSDATLTYGAGPATLVAESGLFVFSGMLADLRVSPRIIPGPSRPWLIASPAIDFSPATSDVLLQLRKLGL